MRCLPYLALCAMCFAAIQAEEVTFKTEKDIAAGSVSGVSSMDVAPINNDAYADVLVVEGGKHAGGRKTFAWFESPANPQGNWIRHNINNGAPLRSFLGAAKLADFDGDGDYDIAVSSDNHSGNSKQADVFIFVNPGAAASGTWPYHKCNASTLPLHHINDMVIADIDDDGKKDIVTRSLNPNQIQIFFQNSISNWTMKTIDTGIASSEGLSVGNINGDRYPDITFSGWWLQTPSNARGGSYAKKPIDSNYQNTNQNTKEDVADIDGDGIEDIVIGPAESYRGGANHVLAWYKNPGSGYNSNWQRHVIRSNTNHHHTVKLADIDGDGDKDLITGKPWSSSGIPREVLIFYNNGSGGFGQVQQVVGGKGLYSGVVYDIGNDGDLDIVGQNVYAGSSKPYLYESELDDSGPQPDTQAPSQPGSFSAQANGSTAIQLTWAGSSDNVGVTAYEIKRGNSVIRSQSGTNYTDSGLNPNTTYNYSVRARDAAGNWSSAATASATTDAAPVNQAPNAVFTTNPKNGVAPLQVSFNASASSDSDGTISSYAWNFGDGSSGNGINATHTYTNVGSFTATLTVTDNDGASDVAAVTITVHDPAPTLRDAYTRIEAESYDAMQGIGIYNGGTGQKIGSIENGTWAKWENVDFASGASGFSASVASRHKVGTITLHLDAIDGPVIGSCVVPVTGGWNNFVDINGAISNAAGVHDLYFVFSGGSGALLDVDYFVFSQGTNPPPANQAPVADFSATPVTGDAPVLVAVDASSSSDSDGSIQTFSWDFGDGTSASGVQASHSYTLAGNYTITLTVTDDDGASDTHTTVITVNDPPPPPVNTRDAYARIEAESYDEQFGLGIYNGGTGQKIGSIENGRWVKYAAIDFADGASGFAASVSSKTIGGEFEIRLDAVDGPLIGVCALPGTGSWEQWVDVTCAINGADGVHDVYLVFHGTAKFVGDVDYFVFNQDAAPVINEAPMAISAADTQTGEAPSTIQFDGSASYDNDGSIDTYAWDFGDGTNATGAQVSHQYNDAGMYTVTLSVTDNDGATATDQLQITITEPAPPSNSDDAIAHWTFDEQAGLVAADSAGNYPASIENGANLNVSGWYASALQCDGQNDYANAGPINISGAAMSMAAWIKPERLDGLAAEGRIISQANGTSAGNHIFMLSPYPKNGGGIGVRFRLKINGSTKTLVATGGGIQVGLWTHVAAVFDGDTMYVYQDGEEVGRMNVSGSISGSNSIPVWIGGNPSGATDRPFAGNIDDVRIYDRALSEDEIMTLADVQSANG